jgi:hypothetical protein
MNPNSPTGGVGFKDPFYGCLGWSSDTKPQDNRNEPSHQRAWVRSFLAANIGYFVGIALPLVPSHPVKPIWSYISLYQYITMIFGSSILVWWFVSDYASIYWDGCGRSAAWRSRTWVWCSSSSTAKQPAEAAEAMTPDDLSRYHQVPRYPVPARYAKKSMKV